MRRVLMLAYFFPPLGGGGVQRSLKYVKYLPAAGYEPLVLTTRWGWTPLRDATLTGDVPPGTTVIRARELPLQPARWALEGALRRAGLPTAAAAAHVGWPDAMAGWIPGAIWHGVRAVRRHPPAVIYSTSSPASAHLAALAVSRQTGVPLVADFRDSWTLTPQPERLVAPLARLSARSERAVVRHARALIVVDECVRLRDVGPGDPRVVVIRNGVDPDDLPSAEPRPDGRRFRIAHVGSLYGQRHAAPVFAALRALADRGALDRDLLDVRMVGLSAVDGGPDAQSVPVSWTGYVEHRAAIHEMAAADVLLFYAPPGSWGPSGKIYEYLATGRPILCVAPADNFATRIVTQLRAGICADPEDPSAIERAIEELWRRWIAGRLEASPEAAAEALRRFGRPRLAQQLAAVLDAAVDGSRVTARPTYAGAW